MASCAALSACGGGGGSGGGHRGGGHPAGGSTQAAAASGRALFTQACGACHTLTGHDDPRHQGGDLLGFHASRAQFLQLASEMPVRHPISAQQVRSIVDYVMSLEARQR